MKLKVLLVVTSHDDLGNTGKKTGWSLPAVAHPYDVFTKEGYDVTFVSPKGGKAPMDERRYDATSMALFKDKMSLLANTLSPDEVKASEFKIIFYAGGHGPMYDLLGCEKIAALGAQIYESGGIVGAVGHGTVGLIPIRLSNGNSIVKGQRVTSFTNMEEGAIGLAAVMPFLLETKLTEYGAKFVGAANLSPNVQVSGRIVTGQNPASATPTAEAIVKVAKELKL